VGGTGRARALGRRHAAAETAADDTLDAELEEALAGSPAKPAAAAADDTELDEDDLK